jgi:hypothetical protein
MNRLGVALAPILMVATSLVSPMASAGPRGLVATDYLSPSARTHLPATKPKPKPKPKIVVRKSRKGMKLRGNTKAMQRYLRSIQPRNGKTTKPERKVAKPFRPTTKPVVQQLDLHCSVGSGEFQAVDPNCFVTEEVNKPTRPPRQVRPSVRLITEVVVRQAVKNVEFPALTVQTQPRGRTLVNAKTIVYTKPFPVDDVVEILTWPVEVRATPVRYVWTFGDGTTLATQTEGSPYPALEIFHQYKKRGQVAVTVTVLYKARYKAPGLGWQAVNGTVAIPGPPTALTVAEAVPVLVAPER